jgi:hypothetical protein
METKKSQHVIKIKLDLLNNCSHYIGNLINTEIPFYGTEEDAETAAFGISSGYSNGKRVWRTIMVDDKILSDGIN